MSPLNCAFSLKCCDVSIEGGDEEDEDDEDDDDEDNET